MFSCFLDFTSPILFWGSLIYVFFTHKEVYAVFFKVRLFRGSSTPLLTVYFFFLEAEDFLQFLPSYEPSSTVFSRPFQSFSPFVQ